MNAKAYRKYIESVIWSEWATELAAEEFLMNLDRLESDDGQAAAEAAEWFADVILGGTTSVNPVGLPLLPVLQGCAGNAHPEAQSILAKLFMCMLPATHEKEQYCQEILETLQQGAIAMQTLAYSRDKSTARLTREMLSRLQPELFKEFFAYTPFDPDEVTHVVVAISECDKNGNPFAPRYAMLTRAPAPGEIVYGRRVLKVMQYGAFPCGIYVYLEGDVSEAEEFE